LGGDLFRQAEVGQVRVEMRVEEDVRRLHVSMDEAGSVGRVETVCDLGDQLRRVGGRQWRVAATQVLAEVGAVDVAHGDVPDAVLLACAEDRNHVRVVD
jgi:hypothetical protein